MSGPKYSLCADTYSPLGLHIEGVVRIVVGSDVGAGTGAQVGLVVMVDSGAGIVVGDDMFVRAGKRVELGGFVGFILEEV